MKYVTLKNSKNLASDKMKYLNLKNYKNIKGTIKLHYQTGILIGLNLFLLVVLFTLYGFLSVKLNKSRANISPNLELSSRAMGI